LGFYSADSGAGIFASVIGALVVLAIYHAVVRKRAATSLTSKDKDRFAA
jgi:hypothetical protein